MRAKLRGAVSFNSGTVQDRNLTKPVCQRYTNELFAFFSDVMRAHDAGALKLFFELQ